MQLVELYCSTSHTHNKKCQVVVSKKENKGSQLRQIDVLHALHVVATSTVATALVGLVQQIAVPRHPSVEWNVFVP